MTLKELKDKAANVAATMRGMHALAEQEKRDFSAVEQSTWDNLNTEFFQLSEKIEFEEVRHQRRQGELRRAALGGSRPAGTIWRDSDGQDVRVLSRGESVAEALGSPGEGMEYRDVTFANFVRAIALGPRTPSERRALSEGTASAGGFTVPAPLSAQLIDRLRARSVVVRAGASVMMMNSQTHTIAKLLTDPTASWHTENNAESPSSPTFGAVTFTARTLLSYVDVSRELLEDSLNIGDALVNAFAKSMAGELDRACLFGSGTAPEPRGLRSTSNVNQVSMGGNGAAITNFDKLMDLRQALDEANAGPSTAWIMAPRTFRKLAGMTDTTNQWLSPPQYLWGNNWVGEPLLDGYQANNPPWLHTTAIPITETQGSATNASTIFTGYFPEMIIGMRKMLEIEVIRERNAPAYQWSFLASLRADMQVAHAESFGRLIGIIP